MVCRIYVQYILGICIHARDLVPESTFMNSNEPASENVELVYPTRYKSVREVPNGVGSCKLRNYVAPVAATVAAARLFMWSEGSFARRKKALNAATQFGKLITSQWKQPRDCTTEMYILFKI